MGWKKLSKFALKLHLQQKPSPKKIIGLDMGTTFTGVSISCMNLKRTYLLKTIKCPIRSEQYCDKLMSVIQREKLIVAIIIGKPEYSTLALGTTQDMMLKNIQEISKKLEQAFDSDEEELQNEQYRNLPYCFIDESRTTMQARTKIHEVQQAIRHHGHLHDTKQLEDGIAAMKILQRFLEYYNKN